MNLDLIQQPGQITWARDGYGWWHGTTALGAMFTLRRSDRITGLRWRMTTNLPRHACEHWAGDDPDVLKATASRVHRDWLIDAHYQVTFTNAINGQSERSCFGDPAAAFHAAATIRPFNNTRVDLDYCDCAQAPGADLTSPGHGTSTGFPVVPHEQIEAEVAADVRRLTTEGR